MFNPHNSIMTYDLLMATEDFSFVFLSWSRLGRTHELEYSRVA